MKNLLILLGSLSVATSPSALLVSSINQNSNLRTNSQVSNHLQAIEAALENEQLTFFGGIVIYQKVYDMIYKITDESYLSSYMNKVYLLQNKLNNLAQTIYEKNVLEAERDKIEKGLLNWSHSENLNELVSLYFKQTSEEKENISKLFYAYNQNSSESMIADLDAFQAAKINNVRAAAQIATIDNQLKLHQTSLSVWEDTLKWQAELLSIYNNMISKAEALENQFLITYNKIFATPAKFFEYITAKRTEILEPLVEKFLGTDKEVLNDMMAQIKNRTQDGTNKLASWVTNNIDADNVAPGDPEENETNIENDDLLIAAELEISKQLDNLNLKSDDQNNLEAKFKIVAKVLEEVYRIDDILFSSMHNSAQKFFEYVNNQIPRLSNDVKDAFDKNGIAVETKFEEDVQDALEIAEAISKQVIDILVPGSDVFLAITEVAFGTIEQIEKWYTSLSVLQNSGKAIAQIKNIRDEYSKIPDDIDMDIDEVIQEITRLKAELIIQQEILDSTNAILAESDYDKLDQNLVVWNKFFNQYTDYLNIINILSKSNDMRINIGLNAQKYFKKQLESYKKIVQERQFTAKLLIEHPDFEESSNAVSIFSEDIKLQKINTFVLEHEGDFN